MTQNVRNTNFSLDAYLRVPTFNAQGATITGNYTMVFVNMLTCAKRIYAHFIH